MDQKRKGFAPIIVILLLAILIAGGAGYYLFFKNQFPERAPIQKQETANTPPAPNANDNCAKDGESPNNFDLTKGKEIPGGKQCCPGLRPTSGKRAISDKAGKSACLDTSGTPGVCRPCGNGVCDPNEDSCNCPEDCK